MTPSEPPSRGDVTNMEVLDFDNEPEPPGRWRPSRLAMAVIGLVLAIGLGVGYLAGHQDAQRSARRPVLSKVTPPSRDDPIVATGNTCSDQLDDRLELGVEVSNTSSVTAILDRLLAILPLPGLRVTAASVGTCGQVTEAPAFTVARLRPGATTWVTMTFDVVVHCPSALPVELELYYHHGHDHVSSRLAEFPDLARVPFSRCPPVKKLLPDR